MLSKQQVIERLNLEPHVEGGYFRRTFEASHRDKVMTEVGERFTLTSIYYLLTDESPIGHWHLNQSDILHAYHLGAPIRYYLIYPDGSLQVKTLGADIMAGHELQFVVPGGVWKASELVDGEYGLLSEAVAPGFDFADMQLGQKDDLLQSFPQHDSLIDRFTRV
jgi:uncharacterized protein